MGLLVAFGIIVLFAIAAGLWGVDSRPGFDGGRIDPKDRWFFHSKSD